MYKFSVTLTPVLPYLLYEGQALTIEWYVDARGRSPAKAYFDDLERAQKMKFLHLVKRMGDVGKIHDVTRFRNEGDKIYAFKSQPDRFLCFFFSEGKLIVTHGFQKKQQKLPPGEKERALRVRQDYQQRVGEGTYYG